MIRWAAFSCASQKATPDRARHLGEIHDRLSPFDPCSDIALLNCARDWRMAEAQLAVLFGKRFNPAAA